MYSCFVKDPPKFEDLLPPEDGEEQERQSPDEITMQKLDAVMLQYGGTVSGRTSAAQPTEPDEWTQKMWRLMGATS